MKTFNFHSTCDGGSEVVLLIKKLEKDQRPLKAKFFDSNWSEIVDIEDSKIHYQVWMIKFFLNIIWNFSKM